MKYNILDAEGGNVINTILADEEFVSANFDHYELWSEPTPAMPTAEGAAAVEDVEGRLRVTSFRVRPRQCVFLIELNNNCFALAGQEV